MTVPRAESVYRRPAAPLRPFVDGYVGYRMTGFPAGFHRGVPTRHLTLISSIGGPIDVVAQADPRRPSERYAFALGGLHGSPARIAHDGNQEGVAIELTPLGCGALLGLPARALWNTSLEASEVIGPAAVELWERVNLASDWDSRFAACDDLLTRWASAPARHEVAPQLEAAWRLLVASEGTEPVAALAAQVGWSRRHLALRFGEEFGLSPKLAARVLRFDRARRLLMRPQRPSLAEVAAVCGYYDQPHLNRDFVELAGCSPGRLLTEEIPSVQDSGGREGAPSAA